MLRWEPPNSFFGEHVSIFCFLPKSPCNFSLPMQAVNRFILQHLQCWQGLAHECAMENVFLFRLRPKTHYLQHIGADVERNQLNPKLVGSCFCDESFLGYIKRIAVKCHAGSMVKIRFWQRYFLLLSLRFEKRRSTTQCRGSGVPDVWVKI